jgi:hypothetical protein
MVVSSRIARVLFSYSIAIGLLLSMSAAGASAANADETADSLAQYYELDWNEWLFRSQNEITDKKSCWTKAKPPRLEAKINGRWKQVAKAQLTEDLWCDGSARYAATYTVVPSSIGFSMQGKDKQTINLRSTNGAATANMYRYVWASRSVHDRVVTENLSQVLGAFNDALTDLTSGDGGTGLPSSGSGLSSSGWSGCYFEGQKMWGTVKVVDFGLADYDVKIVEFGSADLNVKRVEFGSAFGCGEWKFVDYGLADFTVKFVNFGRTDFSIKLVSFGAGR